MKTLCRKMLFFALLLLAASTAFCEERESVFLFGQEVSLDSEEIVFEKTQFENADALREMLSLFENLKRIELGVTNLENEELASVRAENEDFSLVWTMKFAKWSVKTDATAFSTLNNGDYKRGSKTFECLQYCTNLYALDLGHNTIDDLSFLENMTSLRYLILADNRISDISVLSNLTELTYLELFFNRITDINALKGLENLKDLNLCFCPIEDYSALESLPQLERLWFFSYNLKPEDKEAIRRLLPGCEINLETKNAVAEGWREHPHYDAIFKTFRGGEYVEW